MSPTYVLAVPQIYNFLWHKYHLFCGLQYNQDLPLTHCDTDTKCSIGQHRVILQVCYLGRYHLHWFSPKFDIKLKGCSRIMYFVSKQNKWCTGCGLPYCCRNSCELDTFHLSGAHILASEHYPSPFSRHYVLYWLSSFNINMQKEPLCAGYAQGGQHCLLHVTRCITSHRQNAV